MNLLHYLTNKIQVHTVCYVRKGVMDDHPHLWMDGQTAAQNHNVSATKGSFCQLIRNEAFFLFASCGNL